jgi:hypothetical protein
MEKIKIPAKSHDIAVSDDLKYIAVGFYNGYLSLYSLGGKLIWKKRAAQLPAGGPFSGSSFVLGIRFSPDNRYIAWTNAGSLNYCPVDDEDSTVSIPFEKGYTARFEFSRDSRFLYFADGYFIQKITVETGSMETVTTEFPGGQTEFAVSPDNEWIAVKKNSGNDTDCVNIIKSVKLQYKIDLPHKYVPGGQKFWGNVFFNNTGDLVIFHKDQGIMLWDVMDNRLKVQITAQDLASDNIDVPGVYTPKHASSTCLLAFSCFPGPLPQPSGLEQVAVIDTNTCTVAFRTRRTGVFTVAENNRLLIMTETDRSQGRKKCFAVLKKI